MKKTVVALWLFMAASSQIAMAQNAPVATAGTVFFSTATATVPITASNFVNIGSCNLKLIYDPAIILATSVSADPGLGGTLDFNLSVPGEITIGWYTYPGVTIANDNVIFTIGFHKIGSGTSALTFYDDGYSCIYYDGNWNALNDIPYTTYYQNGSVTALSTDAPHTAAPLVSACPGTMVSVPVTVSEFNNIGSVSLMMQYSPGVLTYQSCTVNPGFPGFAVNGTVPGTITANGLAPSQGTGITLPGNAILFTLFFTYSGGSTNLSWFDDGNSCKYTGPPPSLLTLNDSPQNTYYIDGSVGPASSSSCTKNLNLTSVFLEGLYNGGGTMRRAQNNLGFISADPLVADEITVELHNSNYSSVAYTASGINLGITGTATVNVPGSLSGSYYITIKHRNHVETTTSVPVSFSGVTISYALDLPSGVFGGNVKLMPGAGTHYAIYGGEVNQDGVVEAGDMIPVDNLISVGGYDPQEDTNSDGVIDSGDMNLIYENASLFAGAKLP